MPADPRLLTPEQLAETKKRLERFHSYTDDRYADDGPTNVPDPHVVTDDECSLWYCESCSASGVIHVKHVDVYSVINELKGAHASVSPRCEAPIGQVRVARPNGWYKSVVRGKLRSGGGA